MVKEYSSFEDIDKRLKVLKLQREINQESLKLHFYRAKVDLIPNKLLQNIGTTFTQSGTLKNVLLALITKKVLSYFRKKHPKEIKG